MGRMSRMGAKRAEGERPGNGEMREGRSIDLRIAQIGEAACGKGGIVFAGAESARYIGGLEAWV